MPALLAFFLSLSLKSDSSESDSVRLRDVLEEEAPMVVVRVKGKHCGKVLNHDRDSNRSHAQFQARLKKAIVVFGVRRQIGEPHVWVSLQVVGAERSSCKVPRFGSFLPLSFHLPSPVSKSRIHSNLAVRPLSSSSDSRPRLPSNPP